MSEQVRAAPGPALVVGVFGDEVRAEQAAGALAVWRRANPRAGIGPIGVVGRRVSGTTAFRAWGVARPGRAAVTGLVIGAALFGLPAAGAAALAAWAIGSIVFGLSGLVGLVPSNQVGDLVLAAMLAGATLTGVLVGAAGALLGCLVGLIVAFIDRQMRALTNGEVARAVEVLPAGSWAAVARAQAAVQGLARDELARLGASS